MLDLTQIFNLTNSPIGIGVFAGVVTMLYLFLMSINSYLPSVLLLSCTIGYIVYYIQNKCGQCQNTATTASSDQTNGTTSTAPVDQGVPNISVA